MRVSQSMRNPKDYRKDCSSTNRVLEQVYYHPQSSSFLIEIKNCPAPQDFLNLLEFLKE
jgi:hypothetical protein